MWPLVGFLVEFSYDQYSHRCAILGKRRRTLGGGIIREKGDMF